jgi:3-deoxy-manno-octulosonate cytidylyltransferase (CMP-KDO synthetase)
VKVVADVRGFALYFSRSTIPYQRGMGGSENGPHKHLGLYVYRRQFLHTIASLDPTALERSESLEQLRVLENGFAIKVVKTQHDSIGVDTPEDLERVRRLLTADARV